MVSSTEVEGTRSILGAPAPREARLRPEHALEYPDIRPERWEPAASARRPGARGLAAPGEPARHPGTGAAGGALRVPGRDRARRAARGRPAAPPGPVSCFGRGRDQRPAPGDRRVAARLARRHAGSRRSSEAVLLYADLRGETSAAPTSEAPTCVRRTSAAPSSTAPIWPARTSRWPTSRAPASGTRSWRTRGCRRSRWS